MPIILSIDHREYLFPDSVNLNALAKMFQGARSVRCDYEGRKYRYQVEGGAPVVEIKVVGKEQIVTAKQLAEKAGPECNGDMGIRKY